MPKDKIYIEENRFCEESPCKHFKRLIVGFIRFIESSGQDANIPEKYFDDVPDNLGFEYAFFEEEEVKNKEPEDIRCFRLTNTWNVGEDDCGGSENSHEDVSFYVTPQKDNVVHLRLVKNDGE